MKSNGHLALLFAGVLAAAAAMQNPQQQPATDPHRGHAHASQSQTTQSQPARAMPQGCRDMMARWDQAMAELRAADTRLQQRVNEMNASRGEARINAMASAINELATQHRAAINRLNDVHQRAMAHMQEHVASSRSTGTGMTDCPIWHQHGQ